MMHSLAFLAVLLAVGADDAAPRPEVGIDQRLDEQIPLDLVFRDEAGGDIELGDLIVDKPAVLVLAYYRCPRLCSVVLNNLSSCLQRVNYTIGKEFNVITVSIDPEEGPELASAKKQAHIAQYGRPGAATGWHFLTGSESAISRLAKAVGFRYRYDAETREYVHASGIMIVTPRGKISRYFYGVDYSPRDVRFGLEDAGRGAIGAPRAQPLRLLCFAYDPTTGKYTLAAWSLMRAAGGFTVLMLAGMCWLNWRRECRRSALATAESKENGSVR